jgi:hypothetical protein
MLDQILIESACCILGLALGQSAWLLFKLGLKRESNAFWQIPMGVNDTDTALENALYAEVKQETRKDLRNMARRALEACPDVSCDAVAEAFNLPKASVRTLSKGKRTGKRVQTNYSKSEIQELACPF